MGKQRLSVRKSAQDLGIVHPGHFCDKAETIGHYWVETENVYGGVMFKCKECFAYLWLPLSWIDSYHLSELMKIFGSTEGYCRFLNRHRPAKMLMAKMQKLERLANDYANKREFAKMADDILSDKDYDRKEVNR